LCDRDGLDSFTALFSESQARVLLEVPEHLLGVVSAAAEAEAVEMVRVGTTGGELLAISPAEPAGWSGSDTILFDVEELAGESDSVLRKIFD
ncbi:MAG: phosphoribosylformylglycinamidine synthase subunit PurL, partial [Ancrocorticia populi]